MARCLTTDELLEIRAAAEHVYVDRLVLRWLVELVRATRQLEDVSVGASVRASLALERLARAWALVHGRSYVEPADVERLFLPVVAHRLVFEPFALAVEGMSTDRSLLERVRSRVPADRAGSRAGVGWLRQPSTGDRRASRRVVADARRRTFPLVPRHRADRAARSVPTTACAAGEGTDIAGSRKLRTRRPARLDRLERRRRACRAPETTTPSSSGSSTPTRRRGS